MLVEFAIRARGGDRPATCEVLDQMLPETYGVITYQEQLQRVFQTIAGTDGIVANAFREHVAKKKMADVIKDREIFIPPAKEKLGDESAERSGASFSRSASTGSTAATRSATRSSATPAAG
jgi:DNA polymerase-3 subunit alpha